MRSFKHQSHSCGFTLMELLVTLAILGVLASLALPVAEVSVQRSKENELRTSLRSIRGAIDAYKRAYDEGRIRRELDSTGYPPTLEELVDGVEDQRDPKRKKIFFLRRVPRDPFDQHAGTAPAETWGKRSSASEASDPAEGEDIYDVYSRSNKLGLNNIAYGEW